MKWFLGKFLRQNTLEFTPFVELLMSVSCYVTEWAWFGRRKRWEGGCGRGMQRRKSEYLTFL